MRDMKNSGIEWIGEVPVSWNYTKLKLYYEFEKGKNSQLYTASYINNNPGQYPVYSGQTENDGIMGFINTYDYDLDECLFSTTVGAKVMTPKILSGKFCLSQNCLIMKSINNSNNHYFYYYLCSLFDYKKGTIPSYMQPSLRIEDLNGYDMFIPEINEQKIIADFLDKKCADIDEIISAKEKTNELLKERRQSIVTEAVTKGLNPNAEMKDSGIDWIGEIPKHWDTIRLKHLGDAIIGLTYSPMDIVDDGTLVLRSSNIKDGKLVNADNVYVSKDIPEKLKTKKGDILLCSRNGSKALIGKNSVITEDFVGSSFGAFMTIFRSDYNHYLKYVFNSSLFDYYLGTFLTTTINQLTTGNLDSIVIPLPTEEDEMKEIESYIESKCGEIDKLIESNNKTIEKLQEYRKSLIYEAVTGKIEIN